jgi:predicted nucleic acid-binding protein
VAELLVDTDVFVDHLRGARPLQPGSHTLCYSVITRCELFAGSHTDEQAVALLLAPFRELPVDRAVAERAGRIRRETGVRAPDALIAATALVHRLGLVTRNVRDFERVSGLRVRPPA